MLIDTKELGKLQGDKERFLLALAGEFLNGLFLYGKDQIVLMYPNSSVLGSPVLGDTLRE